MKISYEHLIYLVFAKEKNGRETLCAGFISYDDAGTYKENQEDMFPDIIYTLVNTQKESKGELG